MKNIIAMIVLLSALLFLLNRCSKDDNNPVEGDSPVVDPITNTWTDTANLDHRFSLLTYDSTVSRGIFFGEESHPDSLTIAQIHGFFDKTYVEFDAIWAFNRRIKYKGNFVNSNRIDLQSSLGKIVITR
ncbi:MAG TPA: hypothetical protein VMT35_04095 [Ignavibacteriaceae bacterium]|jgi:hypothetical protein|nr:hypothetical protein [Ignavibacteriaceae bacterium]